MFNAGLSALFNEIPVRQYEVSVQKSGGYVRAHLHYDPRVVAKIS